MAVLNPVLRATCSMVSWNRPLAACAFSSSRAAEVETRHISNNRLFDATKMELESTVEKIVVTARVGDEERDFLMNKHASTAFHVAKHISRQLSRSAAFCLITDSRGPNYSSLHMPLTEKCHIEFVDYSSKKHALAVSKAFWHSSAILLGAAATHAFNYPVSISSHIANVEDGYFSITGKPDGVFTGFSASVTELDQLSRYVSEHFIRLSIPFETLRVPFETAQKFNVCLREELVDVEGNVVLARLNGFVIPIGAPVIASTDQIGRFSVVKAVEESGVLKLSGVSLPAAQPVSSYTWNILEESAKESA